MVVDIDIQMKQKELATTFMMVSKKHLCSPWFIHTYFSAFKVNGPAMVLYLLISIVIFRMFY